MERKLFKSGEAERKRQEEIAGRALLHCNQHRRVLRQCFRDSWFGFCSKEQSAFWDCFNKVSRQG